MNGYEQLYESEIKEPILDYEKFVNKYIALLSCYFNINMKTYQNLRYLKMVVLGFNYYHDRYLGKTYIPDNFSFLSENLYEKILNNELSALEYLYFLTYKIIENIESQKDEKNINLEKDLLINFYCIFNILKDDKERILS